MQELRALLFPYAFLLLVPAVGVYAIVQLRKGSTPGMALVWWGLLIPTALLGLVLLLGLVAPFLLFR